MSLRDLDNDIKPVYLLPEEDLAREVLIPALRKATSLDCMMGYFASGALAEIAPGLASFIHHSENPMRLIISPHISTKDAAAIEAGLDTLNFENFYITEDALTNHTLRCLSYLIQTQRLELKIVIRKKGMWHVKVWIIGDGEHHLVVNGSPNMTEAGLTQNDEQVVAFKSWANMDGQEACSKLIGKFDERWNATETNDYIVLDFPTALRNELLRKYSSTEPPTEQEFEALYEKARNATKPSRQESTFKIPAELNFETGDFAYQGQAVSAWCDASYRGILAMATGSGKTITAMICAHKLHEKKKPLLIVVAAPLVPLVKQWCDEIRKFGIIPKNFSTLGLAGRQKHLHEIRRTFEFRIASIQAIVLSYRLLCREEFITELKSFNCSILLIADEVHNLGSQGFMTNPPEVFEYRLGLSATPESQYDEDRTRQLQNYFGGREPVFTFTLEDAIGKCLVPYDYWVHTVYLTETELNDWLEYTEKIKKCGWSNADDNTGTTYREHLLRKRRLILETASQKINKLSELLSMEDRNTFRYALIYATDKDPEQLKAVNELARKSGFIWHELTHEQTKRRAECNEILESFQNGAYQLLTAKRVLDEGINIPQISKAFILASTTIRRQWIQRRGRLLRKCSAIGKTHSVIHDFMVLPDRNLHDLDSDAYTLISMEMERVLEFTKLAQNAGHQKGPLAVISKINEQIYRPDML